MAEKINIREAALDTLLDMERSGKLSHIAVGDTLMRLTYTGRPDRAFYTLLCEGTTEQRIYLDYVLDLFSKTKMKKCKPLIRNLLRLSAYQILFMEVRDAAACNEAVAIAKKRGFKNLSGFVNGVLRNLARNKTNISLPDPEADYLKYLSVKYSMPDWIVRSFLRDFGRGLTEKMLASFLKARPVTIRTNREKISPKELMDQLKREGIVARQTDYFSDAFYIEGFDHLGKIPAFRKGYFTIQDVSAMIPVSVAKLKAGDLVLDVCAAPGGKTFHAADIVGSTGKVIARDLTEYKIDLINENNDRMGYQQIKTEVFDATVPDRKLFGRADLVIADLPCSGLGIMGRKNDIKYHINQDQIKELISLQRKILSVVWQYVRPGGELIYSTCTINKGENEDNVRWISSHTPLVPASIEDRLPVQLKGRTGEKGYIQILPGADEGDGFFVSRFVMPPDKDSTMKRDLL